MKTNQAHLKGGKSKGIPQAHSRSPKTPAKSRNGIVPFRRSPANKTKPKKSRNEPNSFRAIATTIDTQAHPVGQRIRLIRLRAQPVMSQAQFAAKVGLGSVPYLSRLESGKRINPSLEFCMKVCLAFDVSLTWLNQPVTQEEAAEINRVGFERSSVNSQPEARAGEQASPKGQLIYDPKDGTTTKFYQVGPDSFVMHNETLGTQTAMSHYEMMAMLIARGTPESCQPALFQAIKPGALTIQLTPAQWEQLDTKFGLRWKTPAEYAQEAVARELARGGLMRELDNTITEALFLLDLLVDEKSAWLAANGGTYADTKAAGCVTLCSNMMHRLMEQWLAYCEPLDLGAQANK